MSRLNSINIDSITINDYNKIIADHVIEELKDKFGEHAIQSIDMYLSRYNLSLADITNEPNEVRKVLYNLFGNSAYWLEHEIVKRLYKIMDSKLYPKIDNLNHAIQMLKVYFKALKNKDSIMDMIDIIDAEQARYCKCCNNGIDIKDTLYNAILSELCIKCYYTHSEMVLEMFEDSKYSI